jgi:hypothetical protein
MLFICKPGRGECVKSSSLAALGFGGISSDGPIAVSAPVGIKGTNLPDDVVTIQTALNRVQADQGGPSQSLAVDGKCGPKTEKAIQLFQLKHFGWKGADGLIEPGRQTIAKLNDLLGPTGPAKTGGGSGGAPAVVFPVTVRLSIDRALQFILAAQANLLAAEIDLDNTGPPVGPISVFSRASKMRLLNKHFGLDALPATKRRAGFHLIHKVFDRMRQVFHRPGGLWGYAAFEPDPLNTEVSAYTWWGGFFMGGQFRVERGTKIRLDTIYLARKFVPKQLDGQAFVVVHELAHFVGHPELIDDFAYNEDEVGAKIKRLTPELKILNADSYANLAFEAGTGDDPPIFS